MLKQRRGEKVMLVLSRKKGESVMIGDQVEIVVLSVEGDAVKIGINAPKQMEIYRKEIYEAILNSNQEAAQSQIDLNQLSALIKSADKKQEDKK